MTNISHGMKDVRKQGEECGTPVIKQRMASAGGANPSDDKHGAKPSAARRFRRLSALVEEFAARDMNAGCVASFLNCSRTSARKYVNDLLEASVIKLRRAPLPPGYELRRGYHLNGDVWIVRSFLAELLASQSEKVLRRDGEPAHELQTHGVLHLHLLRGDDDSDRRATKVLVRRDPLVAALFGEKSACVVVK